MLRMRGMRAIIVLALVIVVMPVPARATPQGAIQVLDMGGAMRVWACADAWITSDDFWECDVTPGSNFVHTSRGDTLDSGINEKRWFSGDVTSARAFVSTNASLGATGLTMGGDVANQADFHTPSCSASNCWAVAIGAGGFSASFVTFGPTTIRLHGHLSTMPPPPDPTRVNPSHIFVSMSRATEFGDQGFWSAEVGRSFDEVLHLEGGVRYSLSVAGTLETRSHTDDPDPVSEAVSFSVALDATVIEQDGGSMDWTVPNRFGLDADGDGMFDYYGPDGSLEVDPAVFPADLSVDVCEADRTRTWFVDDVEVAHGEGLCSLRIEFPEEGVYDVRVDVVDFDLFPRGSVKTEVVIQDWLIVSMGDSVASGEGNPDLPGWPPSWQNRQCHRSAFAGPAQAARLLELSDPKTSVTFVHLACSGATVDSGILGPYAGVEPGVPLAPQIDQMDVWTHGREIDAVMLSIGANDVEFAGIVERCYALNNEPFTEECHVDADGTARRRFDMLLPMLEGKYALVAAELEARNFPPERLYITEYFDPVRDENQDFCDDEILEEAINIPVATVSAAEAEWASVGLLPQLNAVVAGAATTHGWNAVGNILEPFRPHGYCSNDAWVVRLSESALDQGDEKGTLHPNEQGHLWYAGRIRDAIISDLYPNGDVRPPA